MEEEKRERETETAAADNLAAQKDTFLYKFI